MLNVPIDHSINESFESAGYSLNDIILAMAEGQPAAPSAFALFYSTYQDYLHSERQRLLDKITQYEFQQDRCSYQISIYSHFLQKQKSIDVLTTERDAERKNRTFEDVYKKDEFNAMINNIRQDQRNVTEFTEQALEKWVPVFDRDNLDPETEEGLLLLETIRASYDTICEEQLALLKTTPDSEKASFFESALKTLSANFEHLTEKKTECTTRYQELGIELSEYCERRTLALSESLGSVLENMQPEEKKTFCREFVNSYISPSIEDTEGKTLLHRALDARNSSAIKQLLQVGANPFQKPATHGGLSPLAYAAQLTAETGNATFLLNILDYLRNRPMAHKEHYLPEKGQSPFYKSRPFYDFPSIERDVAQSTSIADEDYQEQQKQIEKNVVGWFVFSEMKEFLDGRIDYYNARLTGLSLGTDPIKRLTQLAGLYQRLYDCLTNNPDGIFDLNLQFDAFRKLLITMEQKELANDKPKANTFFDLCVHANNVIEGRIQSYQEILLDPNQSIHDVLEKERGQLERELMSRETSLKQLELRYDYLGQRYDLLGERYDRLDENHSQAHEVTNSIITDLMQCDADINNEPDHSLSEVLGEVDLAKKLTIVRVAVGGKCENLTYLKTRRVPFLEENLRDGIDEIRELKRERGEQGNVIEQYKRDLSAQQETIERQNRNVEAQEESIRMQQAIIASLYAQIPKSENASNDSNTTNSNEEHSSNKSSYSSGHFHKRRQS